MCRHLLWGHQSSRRGPHRRTKSSLPDLVHGADGVRLPCCHGTIGQSVRRSGRGRASERMPTLQGGIIRWDHLQKCESGSLAGSGDFHVLGTEAGAAGQTVAPSRWSFIPKRSLRQLPLVTVPRKVPRRGIWRHHRCHRLTDLNAINKQCHNHCPVSSQFPRPSHPCPFLSTTPTQYTQHAWWRLGLID